MTPGPMPFRGPIVGPIKITLYSEQQALLCKQRADYHTLEQRLTQTGFLQTKTSCLVGGVLAKDGPPLTLRVLHMGPR